MTVHIEAQSGDDPLHASAGTIRRPAIFAPLFAPFGVGSGYVSVTLAYLLGEAGLSVAIIATLIAVNAWPQTVKMLWAPFVDTIGNPKAWYAIGAFSVGLCILAMSIMPKTEAQVPIFMALIVVIHHQGGRPAGPAMTHQPALHRRSRVGVLVAVRESI